VNTLFQGWEYAPYPGQKAALGTGIDDQDLEIFDLSGRSCWRGTSYNRTNVTGLLAGVYILECTTNDKTGTRLSKRLIIQK